MKTVINPHRLRQSVPTGAAEKETMLILPEKEAIGMVMKAMDLKEAQNSHKPSDAGDNQCVIAEGLLGNGAEPLPCHIECSIEKALDVLGGKWTFLIIRDLQGGTKRFGELRKSLVGVSPKTLSERLKELEEKGVVTRTAYATIPPAVEYALTEKGLSLQPIIKAMKLWGSKWG
jgi:DNA-binding HxlR family transcriptional regulator